MARNAEAKFIPEEHYNPADHGDWTVVNLTPSHVAMLHSPKAMENANAIYGHDNWGIHKDKNAAKGYLVVKSVALDERLSDRSE